MLKIFGDAVQQFKSFDLLARLERSPPKATCIAIKTPELPCVTQQVKNAPKAKLDDNPAF